MIGEISPRAIAGTQRTFARRFGRLRLDAALLGLAVASVAMIAAWYVLLPGDAEPQRVVSDLWTPVVDVIAAGLVVRAALGVKVTRLRLAWGLVGAAMLLYSLGDLLWLALDLTGPQVAFPSVADLAYTAFYPVMAAGLLLFPAAALARREATRLGIDSSIIVLGGGMVVWQSILGPALASPQSDWTGTLLALGYPIGDLVLLFGIATIALRRPDGIEPRALGALVVGLALMFVADVAFGELSLAGATAPHWTDLVYLGFSVLIAIAGYLQAHPGRKDARVDADTLSRWLILLPYAGLAAGFTILVTAAAGNVPAAVGDLLGGAVGLTVLVLLRQELVLRENSQLLAERARRASEARFRTLEANSSDAIVLVDPDGTIAYVSPAVEHVLGLGKTVLVGSSVARLAHADDAGLLRTLVADSAAGMPVGPLEWRLWGQDGVWRQVETVAANLLADPTIGKIVLTTRDVRERQALRREVSEAAFRDALTGLPNRALFRDRVGRALESARRTGGTTAVLYLDLDGFRRLNDSLGHAMGDAILKETAERVTASIRTADTCARLGGDEFAVLLDGEASVMDATEVAERIRAALRAPMQPGGAMLELTASIGIAVTRDGVDAREPRALIRDADIAMSAARDEGRDRAVVFEPSMQVALEGSFELETDLRRAVGAGELVLEYQPIVDLQSGELVGAEALVRWNHPTRGRLGPNVFIPLAEETGLIGEIGTWVLRTACVEVARWASRAPAVVPRVSVNLAASQVADERLPWIVQSALAQAGASPAWLTLEVTESHLVVDTVAILERLHAIRALGIQISVDDFGTGYSSLAYLQEFPIDHIKIDRSFVIPLDDPARSPGLAAAVVEIGRALGMATIAEGIETERQLDRLRSMGCRYGQGFLLGRPLAADAILALVGKPSAALARATSRVGVAA